MNGNVIYSRQFKLSWLKMNVKTGYHTTADYVTRADVMLPACIANSRL